MNIEEAEYLRAVTLPNGRRMKNVYWRNGQATGIEYAGRRWTIAALARAVGMRASTLSSRLHRDGLSVEEALATHLRRRYR